MSNKTNDNAGKNKPAPESIINAKTNKRWERGYMFMSDIIKEERREAREEGREEGLVQGHEEGLIQGREEGILQGREEGELRRAVVVVDNLIIKGFSEEEACEIANISLEEYHKYKGL